MSELFYFIKMNTIKMNTPNCGAGSDHRAIEITLSILIGLSLLYMLGIQIANNVTALTADLQPYTKYTVWANWVGLIIGTVASFVLIFKYHR
jgi:hypothetical protein